MSLKQEKYSYQPFFLNKNNMQHLDCLSGYRTVGLTKRHSSDFFSLKSLEKLLFTHTISLFHKQLIGEEMVQIIRVL